MRTPACRNSRLDLIEPAQVIKENQDREVSKEPLLFFSDCSESR